MGENKVPDPMQNPVHRSLATSVGDWPAEINDLALQNKDTQKAIGKAFKKMAKGKKKCRKEEVNIKPKSLDACSWDPVYGRIPGTEKY